MTDPAVDPTEAQQGCRLCQALAVSPLIATEQVIAILDKYPVSPGHCLILPKRHTPLFWDLDQTELMALLAVLTQTRELIDEKFAPDGYNVGVNVGEAAGQTIGHVHLHLIPRYRGDDADPRGGIRWVLPERAIYWEAETNGGTRT